MTLLVLLALAVALALGLRAKKRRSRVGAGPAHVLAVLVQESTPRHRPNRRGRQGNL